MPILEQALTLPLDPQDELDLRRTRLEVFQQTGQRESAYDDLARAMDLAGRMGRRDLIAHLERHGAVLHHDAKDMAQAEAAYERSLVVYRELGDEPAEAVVLRNMGHLYRELGQHTQAEASLDDALQISLRRQDAVGEASTRGAMGLLFLERGALAQAETSLNQAVRSARAIGDASREAVHLSNLGLVYAEGERFKEAHQTLKRATRLHEQVGQRRHLALTYGYRGNVYLTEGRASEARPVSPFPKLALPALFLRKSTEPIPLPSAADPRVDPRLDALVSWLTSPHPEGRPESARHALEALRSGSLPQPLPTDDESSFFAETTDS